MKNTFLSTSAHLTLIIPPPPSHCYYEALNSQFQESNWEDVNNRRVSFRDVSVVTNGKPSELKYGTIWRSKTCILIQTTRNQCANNAQIICWQHTNNMLTMCKQHKQHVNNVKTTHRQCWQCENNTQTMLTMCKQHANITLTMRKEHVNNRHKTLTMCKQYVNSTLTIRKEHVNN